MNLAMERSPGVAVAVELPLDLLDCLHYFLAARLRAFEFLEPLDALLHGEHGRKIRARSLEGLDASREVIEAGELTADEELDQPGGAERGHEKGAAKFQKIKIIRIHAPPPVGTDSGAGYSPATCSFNPQMEEQPMFGIGLGSAAIGFAACAVVSISFPKAWSVIQTGARRGVAATLAAVGLIRARVNGDAGGE